MKFYFKFLILLLGLPVYSQLNVTGVIHDLNDKPIEFAEVSILNDDNKIIKVGLTDNNGNFTLEVPGEKSILQIRHLGNTLLTQEILINQSTNLGVLKVDTNNILKEVIIAPNKKLIERKVNRFVFNVENSITSNGRDFFDILNNAPGVRVSNDGLITAMGKGAIIYVDGKIVKLSGNDLADFFKGKAAEDIVKIEVYTNPPAKFDAEGAAVIDIITKKKSILGYDVLVRSNYRQSTFPKFGSGITVNTTEKKARINAQYSNDFSKNLMLEEEYINYNTNSNTSNWLLHHERINRSKSHNYKFVLDYDLSNKDLISFQYDGSTGRSRANRIINAEIYSNQILDSTIVTQNLNEPNRNLNSFNLNYKRVIDSLGKYLSFDIDKTIFKSGGDQNILSNSYSPDAVFSNEIFNTLNNSNQEITINSFKSDYSNPINDQSGFDTGYKYSYINTDNDLKFWDIVNNNLIIDQNKSNIFTYKENNHALYFSYYSTLFKLIDYEVGLRGEYTLTEGYSQTNNQTTERDYFKFFPTIYLQYQINDANKINLNYGKRISRPDYWRLNPFRFYTTPNTYLQGNPFLNPSFTHNIELLYSLKSKYFFTLYYTHVDDVFTNITEQDNNTNTLVNNQVNLDKSINYGFHVIASFSYKKWYEGSLFSQFAMRKEASAYLGSTFNNETPWFYTSLSNFFVLSKDKTFKSELSLKYATKSVQGIYEIGSTFDLSAGIRKSFYKNKLNVSLNVNDIFYRTFYKIDVDYLDQNNGFIERNDSRIVTFSLSYKFSKNKVDKTRDRNSGNESERKRI